MPLIIPDAVARIDFIMMSSIRCISNSVSWPIDRRCLSKADRVHLWPTSSASGSSLLNNELLINETRVPYFFFLSKFPMQTLIFLSSLFSVYKEDIVIHTAI